MSAEIVEPARDTLNEALSRWDLLGVRSATSSIAQLVEEVSSDETTIEAADASSPLRAKPMAVTVLLDGARSAVEGVETAVTRTGGATTEEFDAVERDNAPMWATECELAEPFKPAYVSLGLDGYFTWRCAHDKSKGGPHTVQWKAA